MSEYYKLKVKKVVRETAESISITMDIPRELKELFSYKPGQFLTIKTEIDGKVYSRAYSVSSSPFMDPDITVTVKEIEDGFVSKHMNRNVHAGDILEVMSPRGKFTIELKPEMKRLHILFAAGSGVTPILSILKSILFKEIQSKVVLVYSNRSTEKMIFRDVLNSLVAQFADRFKIIHFLTQGNPDLEHIQGRIDKNRTLNILRDYGNDASVEKHYYLCGPRGMMNEIEAVLTEFNVEKQYIHKESFNSGKDVDEVYNKVKIVLPVDKKKDGKDVKIKIYNEEHIVSVKTDETILEAAMRDGYDPPFSCQIGACATCRAKLVSGNVVMDERDGLTDDEINQGYILTCQSHPVTENVYVDYDDQY